MALFTNSEPGNWPPRARERRWVGWLVLTLAIVGVSLVAFVPAPYVIEQPGPVFDTLGSVQVDGEEVPLIDIPTEETFPTTGELDMLTVTILGSREELPSWVEVGLAYLDPSKAVLPIDEVYPEGVTVEQSNEQSRIEMENSQKEAVAAALTSLGHEFESTLTVVETLADGPADGTLRAGDVIETVNGATFEDVPGLREEIAANGVEAEAEVVVLRNGQERVVLVKPALSEDVDEPTPIFGIIVGSDYDFPFEVRIQLENVGGPSAGMMFALGIIDKLTPGAITGGEEVAGTGTISATGQVGPIGGIRQKMHGARDAGADWFLAPRANCDEVTGQIPNGLEVFAVETIDDALAVLKAIESGGDTGSIPTCPAS